MRYARCPRSLHSYQRRIDRHSPTSRRAAVMKDRVLDAQSHPTRFRGAGREHGMRDGDDGGTKQRPLLRRRSRDHGKIGGGGATLPSL